ncbi:MAG: radical SAM protein [Deltaproteobacteria bacterium]|nr:radical SAM protein [Deltaproteobacteria bacterium]
MKVLFIQPFSNVTGSNHLPVGFLYISAYMLAHSKHEIKIIDLRAKRTPIESKTNEILQWKPDIVGITGLSIEWSGIKHVTKVIRELLGKNIPIVAGGAHATCFSKLVMKDTSVDYIVKNEGERTFLALVNALGKGEDVQNIKGIVYRKNGAIVDTGQCEFIEDIDEIPFPAYHLLDMEVYFDNPRFHTSMNIHNRVMPILSARGCPFQCKFCVRILGYKFRTRSAENVLAEIDWLVKTYNVRELHIEDDAFNTNMKRAKNIMQGIIDRDYHLSIILSTGIRGDLVDQELIDVFKKAGVFRIGYGVETTHPRIQNMIKKELDFDKLEKSILMANRAGISTNGFFIIGFPTETEQEMMATINYALKSKLATAVFSILKLFPGTALAEEYLTYDPDFNDDFTFSFDSPIMPNHSAISDKRLMQLRRFAFIRFYFNPSRIWRIFRTTPNKKNLITRNLNIVLSLIFKGTAKY